MRPERKRCHSSWLRRLKNSNCSDECMLFLRTVFALGWAAMAADDGMVQHSFQTIAELWPPRKNIFEEETWKLKTMEKCCSAFLILLAFLIGSVCWQSSGLRSWKPAQTLKFGPHSEVAWTDLISVQLSIQADWEPREFAVDVQPKIISQVFTCFQIYEAKSWIQTH